MIYLNFVVPDLHILVGHAYESTMRLVIVIDVAVFGGCLCMSVNYETTNSSVFHFIFGSFKAFMLFK
ncbi:hypothetical protein MtrunA17_Chr2g0289001 [Medicago truncatula]|uniref:Uncharacterized protein n=1 Tax=Medicago truncatula TaxID=3880 RepID=A0A396J3F6_MEDTR|nr:hypothetical protein MtrunA17_Chr2g0289001 [Medicago truncatula]